MTFFRKSKKKPVYKAKYGIIQRNGENLGFFSFFITILGGIDDCYRNGLIPVVDMRTGVNQYKRKESDNAWEYFFEQPGGIRLDDIGNWNEVTIINCENVIIRPYQNMDYFTNQQAIMYWHKFAEKNINFTKEVQSYINLFLKRHIQPYKKGNGILGVLARGTDYTELRPFGHPVQPSYSEIKSMVDLYLKKYKCEKIFLATEDQRICEQFLADYGDCVIVPDAIRYMETNGKYLSELKTKEKNFNMETLTYIATIVGLAQCDYLVAGRTSGTVAATIFSSGYKDSYFFNVGKYGIDDIETLELGKR
ncbi:MAG: hypothetical protein ACI4F0_10190 [Agathobacter sp.]